ncbi:MAG: hypothetical protein NC420_11780 [Eubacterium sp.]|nr:hypothetical protein [Eubacterium sp.]
MKSLDGYTLTDDEYHTALMLLFYFRSTTEEAAALHLNELLYNRNSFIENKVAETSARNLCNQAQKHFASELCRERRATGANDAVEVAAYTEKGSAANLILGKTPSFTNIRSVKGRP